VPKYKLFSFLTTLPLAIRLWQEISIDFIIGLLPLINLYINKYYNVILVIVDRFIKYIIYIAINI
jgi:cobalamin synthase